MRPYQYPFQSKPSWRSRGLRWGGLLFLGCLTVLVCIWSQGGLNHLWQPSTPSTSGVTPSPQPTPPAIIQPRPDPVASMPTGLDAVPTVSPPPKVAIAPPHARPTPPVPAPVTTPRVSSTPTPSPKDPLVQLQKLEFSAQTSAIADLASLSVSSTPASTPLLLPDTASVGSIPQGLSDAGIPHQYVGKVVRKVAVQPMDKVIALTFDDGPWPKYTPQILDILKQHHVKATFFWIGQHLELHHKIGKRVVEEGHSVGNHTWHHHYEPTNPTEVTNEIEHTAKLMRELTGVKTTLFRPPGGRLENGLVAYAERKGYTTVLWSVMPADTKADSAKTILDRVLEAAKPGGIILLHDGGGNRSHTVEALPKIITGLHQQGYRFVTIPELLQRPTISTTSAKQPQI